MKEIALPSGATLKITMSSFAVSKALYQAILKEVKLLQIDSKTELTTLYKELFCVGFSSPEIEKSLWECFKRCIYNSGKGDLKIDESTFEAVEAREDYMTVCMEVAKENIAPFMKHLMQVYSQTLASMESTPT